MYAITLLETWLRGNCLDMHSARISAVVRVVEGLLTGGKATLTELGRHLGPGAFEKHGIKCADRLIGNRHLHGERISVYQSLGLWLLSRTERPWILVDWSDVELGHDTLMLTAAVPVGGRAVPIYEEVHRLKHYNSPKTHQAFLEHLASVVPSSCKPIIVTDAGFRGPWFRAVERLGWDWIGRVRNQVKYRPVEGGRWKMTASMYYRATRTATWMGRCWLSAKHPYLCNLHLYKASNRGPGRPRKPRRAVPNNQRNRAHAREPWLLATSLPVETWPASRVVSAYEKRMQIEETFRDLKSHRWGYGLQYARSRSTERLENLLLITTLAMVTTWLVGLAAKANDWMRHFQANTVRKKAVLSTFFLGRRTLKNTRLLPSEDDIQDAKRYLPELVYGVTT